MSLYSLNAIQSGASEMRLRNGVLQGAPIGPLTFS